MIIIDEAASTKKKIVFETIIPVAMVDKTAFIAISSPKNESNWFSNVFRYKTPDGKPMFVTHSFKNICADCKTKGPIEMMKCPHSQASKPAHKDDEKARRFKPLYDNEGMSDNYAQEMRGIITRSSDTAFAEDELKCLFDIDSRWKTTFINIGTKKSIQEILVCVDPNGGGSSYAAITIGYVDTKEGKTVVSPLLFFSNIFINPYFFFFYNIHFLLTHLFEILY